MTYYEGIEEPSHSPKAPPTGRCVHAKPAGHVDNNNYYYYYCKSLFLRITQSARKFFEELIAQQSGKPVSQQRVRGKRTKPKKDSVFHRLLERFDHLKA